MTDFQVAWPSCEVLPGDGRRRSAFAGSSRREENKSKVGELRKLLPIQWHGSPQTVAGAFHGTPACQMPTKPTCLPAYSLRHTWLRPAQVRITSNQDDKGLHSKPGYQCNPSARPLQEAPTFVTIATVIVPHQFHFRASWLEGRIHRHPALFDLHRYSPSDGSASLFVTPYCRINLCIFGSYELPHRFP